LLRAATWVERGIDIVMLVRRGMGIIGDQLAGCGMITPKRMPSGVELSDAKCASHACGRC